MRKRNTPLQSVKESTMYSIICEYYERERVFPSIRHLTNTTSLKTKSVTGILRALRMDGYIEQGKYSEITGLPLKRTNWLTKSIRVAA